MQENFGSNRWQELLKGLEGAAFGGSQSPAGRQTKTRRIKARTSTPGGSSNSIPLPSPLAGYSCLPVGYLV